jgi:hypothetical protein
MIAHVLIRLFNLEGRFERLMARVVDLELRIRAVEEQLRALRGQAR